MGYGGGRVFSFYSPCYVVTLLRLYWCSSCYVVMLLRLYWCKFCHYWKTQHHRKVPDHLAFLRSFCPLFLDVQCDSVCRCIHWDCEKIKIKIMLLRILKFLFILTKISNTIYHLHDYRLVQNIFKEKFMVTVKGNDRLYFSYRRVVRFTEILWSIQIMPSYLGQ